MIEWVSDRSVQWLGVPKDAAACTAYKNALASVQNSLKNLKDDLAALDAARIEAAQNGQDTSQLDAQRPNILNAIAAAQAQINDLNAKITDACKDVTPGPGINTTCTTDGDCTSDYECVNGNCLPRCPSGWTRQADGSCAQVAASAKGSSNWGLFALAGGAAAAIFLGFRASDFKMRPGQKGQQHRSLEANPRRRGGYVVIAWENGHPIPAAHATTKRIALQKAREIRLEHGVRTTIRHKRAA